LLRRVLRLAVLLRQRNRRGVEQDRHAVERKRLLPVRHQLRERGPGLSEARRFVGLPALRIQQVRPGREQVRRVGIHCRQQATRPGPPPARRRPRSPPTPRAPPTIPTEARRPRRFPPTSSTTPPARATSSPTST